MVVRNRVFFKFAAIALSVFMLAGAIGSCDIGTEVDPDSLPNPGVPGIPGQDFIVIGDFYGLSGSITGDGFWHAGYWSTFNYAPLLPRPNIWWMGRGSPGSGVGREGQDWNLSGFDYISFYMRADFATGPTPGANSAQGEIYRFFLETGFAVADRFFVNDSDITITDGFNGNWVRVDIPIEGLRNADGEPPNLAVITGWRIHRETTVRPGSVIGVGNIVARKDGIAMPGLPPPPPPPPAPIVRPDPWTGGAPGWTWPGDHRKRGVGFSFNHALPAGGDRATITRQQMELLRPPAEANAPGIHWFYNWSHSLTAHVSEASLQNGVVFVPQLWNASWSPATLCANVAEWRAAGHTVEFLMTYNEPMLPDQAHMTPQAAAADWRRLVPIARELDLKLVSPAMTFGTIPRYGHPQDWLTAFLEQDGVYIEDIHAIRIHTYMSHLSAVKWYVELFKPWGRPIWITEFSAWYYVPNNQAGGVQWQMDFMSEVLVYLELNPWVEKYFWFIPLGGYAGPMNQNHPFHHLLYNTNPPTLTPLGVVYVNMPNFDRTQWIPAGQRMIARDITNANTSTAVLTPGGAGSPAVRFRPSTDTAADSAPIDIHHFTGGRWIEFQVEVPAGGSSTLGIRNMAASAASMVIYVNGAIAHTVPASVLTTSAAWRTTSVPLALGQGRHTIRLRVPTGNVALNWLILE